jgi:hypothetical protein
MRLILTSRAYQLSSTTKPTNEKDHRYYSHYYVRRLQSEALHDAIYAFTGVPDAFDGYPLGLRAVQIPDPNVRTALLSAFARPERLTACACERSNDVTLVQTLHLLGSDETARKIRAANGRLSELLKSKKSDAELIDELTLTALARLPNDRERTLLLAHVESHGNRAEAFQDCMWAMMNMKEFLFNH